MQVREIQFSSEINYLISRGKAVITIFWLLSLLLLCPSIVYKQNKVTWCWRWSLPFSFCVIVLFGDPWCWSWVLQQWVYTAWVLFVFIKCFPSCHPIHTHVVLLWLGVCVLTVFVCFLSLSLIFFPLRLLYLCSFWQILSCSLVYLQRGSRVTRVALIQLDMHFGLSFPGLNIHINN